MRMNWSILVIYRCNETGGLRMIVHHSRYTSCSVAYSLCSSLWHHHTLYLWRYPSRSVTAVSIATTSFFILQFSFLSDASISCIIVYRLVRAFSLTLSTVVLRDWSANRRLTSESSWASVSSSLCVYTTIYHNNNITTKYHIIYCGVKPVRCAERYQ